jgi:O-antigen ligase
MKNFREEFPLILVIVSYFAFLISIAVTPVGGWCESNPHHEDYKFAFLASMLMVFGSMVLLFATSKSKRND